MLNIVCDRLCGGLANAGIQARRMAAADVHDWLLRWFNPRPTLLGPGIEDRERLYALARYPDETEDGAVSYPPLTLPPLFRVWLSVCAGSFPHTVL
ncbi:TraC family protein, partial [Escherichia coli]|nr:TraC family protein [Escherichia coli]